MNELFGAEPLLLAGFCLAAFSGFFVSAVVGIGGAMVLMPVLMLALSPAEAVALASPVMLANNVLKLFVFRAHLDAKAALFTCLTAVPAAGVAAMYTGVASERALKGGIAVLILLTLLVQRVLSLNPRVPLRGLPLAGVVIGGVSGLSGAAGAPTALTFKGYGLVKESFVATVGLLGAAMQLSKIPTYVVTGVLRDDLWPLALLLSFTSLFAVVLARRAQGLLDAARFRLLLDVVLVLLSVWLLGDAVLASS